MHQNAKAVRGKPRCDQAPDAVGRSGDEGGLLIVLCHGDSVPSVTLGATTPSSQCRPRDGPIRGGQDLERRTDQGLTQAPGIHKFHYALYPHTGTWENGCLQQAEQVNYPLVPVQTHRTFGKLPSESTFLKVGSPKLVISALKKAGRKDAVILRLYNPSTQCVETEVQWLQDLAGVKAVNLNEETLPAADRIKFKGRKFKISIGAKKIATYKVKFQDPR